MAEQLTGVTIDTEAIQAAIPRPIELRKLVIDNFRGHVEPADVERLGKALSDPYDSGSLGDAFSHYKPAELIALESPDRPGEKETYRVPFESMEDFSPASLLQRIPVLRRFENEEQGLLKIMEYARSAEGAKAVFELISDEDFIAAQERFAQRITAFLERQQRVVPVSSAGA